MNTIFFLGETINGENPATSLEIESTQDVKLQNSKMIAVIFFLSSPSVLSFLNYGLHLSVYKLCVK